MKEYDLVVIGGGPGGYVAAIRAAQLGLKVCVVEENGLGGTCLQRGCIPTKTMTRVARTLSTLRSCADVGIAVQGVSFDYPTLCKARGAVVDRLSRGIGGLLKKNKVALAAGRASFVDRHKVIVEGKDAGEISAKKFIIASGSRPWSPDAFKIDGKKVCNSDHALAWDELPKSIVIAGGGYIGCEFASAFAAYGVQVTVVEMTGNLVPGADGDISKELLASFRKRKIQVLLDSPVKEAVADGNGARVTPNSGQTLSADVVLVTLGRRPRSDDLNLSACGLTPGQRGEIPVNDECLTDVKHIYAIGDVTGKILLAHFASAQALIAAEHAAGKRAALKKPVVPSAIFTYPEIASVGLTEAQAIAGGKKARSAKFPFMALGRAQASGESEGFVKIVADEQTEEILGVHMIGHEVTELIAEAALAMRLEGTVSELASTIHAHPTFPEALMEAAEVWLGKGIHI